MPSSYSSASSARFLGNLEERNLRRLIQLAKEEGGKAVEAYGFTVWLPRRAAVEPWLGTWRPLGTAGYQLGTHWVPTGYRLLGTCWVPTGDPLATTGYLGTHPPCLGVGYHWRPGDQLATVGDWRLLATLCVDYDRGLWLHKLGEKTLP